MNEELIIKAQCSYSELQQWGHTSEELQYERFAVENIELPAAEFNPSTQQWVTLIICVCLQQTTAATQNRISIIKTEKKNIAK